MAHTTRNIAQLVDFWSSCRYALYDFFVSAHLHSQPAECFTLLPRDRHDNRTGVRCQPLGQHRTRARNETEESRSRDSGRSELRAVVRDFPKRQPRRPSKSCIDDMSFCRPLPVTSRTCMALTKPSWRCYCKRHPTCTACIPPL